MGISVEATENIGRLNGAKYAGIVLDFDTVPRAEDFWITTRQGGSNRYSLVLAIATDLKQMERTLRNGVHFVLRRPLDANQVARTLDAAYGTLNFAYTAMIEESRRYFRCAASLPVRLTRIGAGTTIECLTVNVSSAGMAVSSSVAFAPAEALDITLTLPDGFEVMGIGLVAWKREGQVGIHFRCSNPLTLRKLDSWLDTEFETKRTLQGAD
jgi:PilZ domain-containing protein